MITQVDYPGWGLARAAKALRGHDSFRLGACYIARSYYMPPWLVCRGSSHATDVPLHGQTMFSSTKGLAEISLPGKTLDPCLNVLHHAGIGGATPASSLAPVFDGFPAPRTTAPAAPTPAPTGEGVEFGFIADD